MASRRSAKYETSPASVPGHAASPAARRAASAMPARLLAAEEDRRTAGRQRRGRVDGPGQRVERVVARDAGRRRRLGREQRRQHLDRGRLSRSIRSPIGGSGIPNGSCSPSNQPAPRPSTNRPPVAWSRTVAALASSTGWRNVFDSTAWPTRTPGHVVDERREQRERLERRPGRRPGPCPVRWSFIQAPSDTPARRQLARPAARWRRASPSRPAAATS